MEQTHSQMALEAVKKWILSGELASGAIVNEREIAEKLGLSRTPVREALGRLEGEGRLRKHGRSVVVSEIRLEEVMEVLALRMVLECEAVRLAATRLTAAQLGLMRRELEKFTKSKGMSPTRHWAVDDIVHLTIAEATGNQLLKKIIRELREKTRIFDVDRIPNRFDPGKAEHLDIVSALEAKNVDGAVNAMRRHLENVRQGIISNLTGS